MNTIHKSICLIRSQESESFDEMDIAGIGSYGVLDELKPEEKALLDAEKAKF